MVSGLISLVIYLVVIGLIFWLLLYIIDQIPLFEPFRKVARIVVIVVGCLILIMLLLQMIDGGSVSLPRMIR